MNSRASGWRGSTGVIGSDPCFIGATGGVVWVGNHERTDQSRRIAGFDERDGTPARKLELPTRLDGWEVVDGPLIAQSAAGAVSVFDLETGQQAFRASFPGTKLVGAYRGQLLLTRASDPPELLLIDGRSGAIQHTIKLGLGLRMKNERFIAGHHAVFLATSGVVGVDLDRARVVFKTSLPDDVRVDGMVGGQVFLTNAVEMRCIDVENGKQSWKVPLDAKVVGENLYGLRVGRERVHVIGGLQRRTGRAMLITTFDRATGNRGETVERQTAGLPVAATLPAPDLPCAVIADRQVELHRPGRASIRLPIPAGQFRKQLWTTEHVFLLGEDLLGIELATLPDSHEAGLVLKSVASDAADSPATVTMVGTSAVVLFRHPLYGDVRAFPTSSSPPVKVGDRVIFEGVSQRPGGVIKIDDWRLAGDGPAMPSVIELGVEALPRNRPPQFPDESLLFGPPVVEQPAAPVRPPLTPLVKPIEQLFGGAPIPVLRTLARACDASPATREHWEALTGVHFDLTVYEPEEEVPGLEELGFLPFAAEDDRIFYGVVCSPQQQQRGIAVLNAEGDHDFFWSTDTFESWLAEILSNRLPDGRVRFLLEDLDLPDSFLQVPSAPEPSWFSEASD